jgi:hypothetical protein
MPCACACAPRAYWCQENSRVWSPTTRHGLFVFDAVADRGSTEIDPKRESDRKGSQEYLRQDAPSLVRPYNSGHAVRAPLRLGGSYARRM